VAAKRYTRRSDIERLKRLQNHQCAKCGCQLEVFHIDHHIALVFGGTDTFENKQLLCVQCHKVKTFGTKATTVGSDIHGAAKIRRILAKTSCKPKKKGLLKSRGFDRTLTRHFDGSVSRRKP
jgi:hypothetical protein